MNIIDVTAENVERTGFFCKMSARKSAGYRRKMAWLQCRFAEGLRIRMLDIEQGGRGFIEYLPGEFAWRAVRAAGYMFIHCLWVVGKSKGNGYASALLDICIQDARDAGLAGVAMVTTPGNWLLDPVFLLKRGFTPAATAPPNFALLVLEFSQSPSLRPAFPQDWDDRARSFGNGLTIVRSDQCPYLDDASLWAAAAAERRGIPVREVELISAVEVQERAPTPYGVFALVRDGELLSYHYLTRKDLEKKLDEVDA